MDFDPDQNSQIEAHYIACKEKIKNFGDKFIIVGDQNMIKSGW